MLLPHEPPAVTLARPHSDSVFVFTCDHASARVPECLGDLGVPAQEWARHIAWDIGALGVAERLAAHFDATLVASGYSRLVIDLNRQLWRHDSIPEVSEHTPIPGNCNLPAAARAARAEMLHAPYHQTIDDLLTARAARGVPTAYVAIHSFTPSFKGDTRPWHIALLSHRDRRMTDLLLEALHAEPDLVVGDNTPYRVSDETDYGIPVHAERRGLPHLLIELRQDEIATPAGQEAWAMRLAPLLAKVAGRLGLTTGG